MPVGRGGGAIGGRLRTGGIVRVARTARLFPRLLVVLEGHAFRNDEIP